MDCERQKKLYRKKLRAKLRERKRKIKSIKMAEKRKRKRIPNLNLRCQLKEQLSPTFNRTAYMPESGANKPSKDVFNNKKFIPGNWKPPQTVDEPQDSKQ